MGSLQIFINAIIVALMAMYVYENERKMGEMSARHSQTENQQITGTRKLTEIENQQISGKRNLTEVENQLNAVTRKLAELENQLLMSNEKVLALEKKHVDEIKDLKLLLSTKAGIEKLTEIGNQQLKLQDKVLALEKKLVDEIKDMKQLLSTKAGIEKLTEIGNQQLKLQDKVLALEKKLVDEIKDTKQLLSTKAGIEKLTEIGNQQLKLHDKGVTYIRWGKTKCDGSNTETIYSGQVGGGHFTHTGTSVNYVCLPNNPEVAQPLKSNANYDYLYGGEYEIFGYNQPQGIRSGIGQHDAACAACLAKGKVASIMIPGRKTCYNGWTKEYEGVLMAGKHSHAAASEYACVDRDAEAIAGGSNDANGILFYPVKTQCGSLKCPPYIHDTAVLCVVCSK